MLVLEPGEVFHHQLAVRRRVEILGDQLRGRGDREIDGLTPQREQRLFLLGVDLAAGPLEDLVLLLARSGELALALLLGQRLRLGQDFLRFGLGVPDRALVLLEQARGFGPGPLRLVQLLLDPPLAVFDRLQQRRPAEPPQRGEQDHEHDHRPDDDARIDGERREAARRSLLQHQQQRRHYLMSLNSSANTRAARPTPSISAAVRIIAPRMSPEACGCRAIASTAWPPMRPMPRPTPITARPRPSPAPSSALVFFATSAETCAASWTRRSMLTMTCPYEWCADEPSTRLPVSLLVLVLHHPDEHARQERKDIGLEERHQQLQAHHEQDERDRPDRHAPVREQEDQTEQRQDHEVARGHVGEESQAQRERL